MTAMDALKIGLVFLNAFATFIAAATEAPSEIKLACAALVAGCSATLAMMERVGGDVRRKTQKP